MYLYCQFPFRCNIVSDLDLQCIDVGHTRVFGVPIAEVLSRPGNKYNIPIVIQVSNSFDVIERIKNCISHLDCYGLEVEGIFRLTGSASLVQYFKEQFDHGKRQFLHQADTAIQQIPYSFSGVDVDLLQCPDPHTVASLLKLYLRELPEPLLTYELYDNFIAIADLGEPNSANSQNSIIRPQR